MAEKGTRNTAIAFGDYEIAVTLTKANGSRDLKVERVNAFGEKVTNRGGGGGGYPPGAAKAVRLAGDIVVRLPAEELEAIEKASKDAYATMRVLETIDYRQVPTERIVASYWMQPHAGTGRGLRLLAEGLKRTGRVAVVKWVATSREKLGVIRVRRALPRQMEVGPGRPRDWPRNEAKLALLLSELTFANDFLAPDEDALAINDVEIPEGAIEAAERLVKAFARRGEHKLDTASDEAVDARLALFRRLAEKQSNEALAEAFGEGGQIGDLEHDPERTREAAEKVAGRPVDFVE